MNEQATTLLQSHRQAIYNAAKEELIKRRRKRCKDLKNFVKEFWDIIVPNELKWNWHMDVLCDEIQESDSRVFKRLPKLYDSIFNVPPGATKTIILSIMSTAWEFSMMPEIRVFVGSYSDSAVIAIADNIRLLMKSEKYLETFPNVQIRKDFDTKHEFKTVSNGHFYAFTVGGTLTSKHADILKIDDPLNPKQAVSQAQIETANAFFDLTLPTRKVDKEVTPTYLIMQRLTTNDPTGHLLEKDKTINHVCLPGELSNDVKPEKYKKFYTDGLLDQHRLKASSLKALHISLGSAGYAGQIQQRPVQEGGLIWKKWFIEIDDALFPPLKSLSLVGTDWDLAYTDDDANAASAYITAGRLNNKMFIDDVGAVYLEFPELIKFMKTRKSPHYIEAKASGKSAKQTLVKNGIPAIEVEVSGGDKVARARFSTPYPEAGMCYIRKSVADFLYNDSRQGILNFPKGSHKDIADALAQAIQRIFRGGIKVGGPGNSMLDDLDFNS